MCKRFLSHVCLSVSIYTANSAQTRSFKTGEEADRLLGQNDVQTDDGCSPQFVFADLL